MRIYISYSQDDESTVNKIVDRLEGEGHEIWRTRDGLKSGDNIQAAVLSEIERADVLIAVISEGTFKSRWVQYELTAIALENISKRKCPIFPVLIDESAIPSYLNDTIVIDMSVDFESGLDRLSQGITCLTAPYVNPSDQNSAAQQGPNCLAAEYVATSTDTRTTQLRLLRESLRQGRLTLVCGAGVSIDAGVPSWNNLLLILLVKMMEAISHKLSIKLGREEATAFQKRAGASTLILGKYLKNSLGEKDFPREVRDALYSSNPTSSELIKSIVQLSTPQRDRKPLDSIVTFNFDSLIEENLSAGNIANQGIHSDSVAHPSSVLPIYHVHGFLPREGDIPSQSVLVFAEDAYHTQFLDPFSWSNLIQLNKLTQNTCLFLGISLSDPNMRRLLDVVSRKSAHRERTHYIIKKLPCSPDGSALDRVSVLLEEQDANVLGLNVVWVEDFKEIAPFVCSIAQTD